MDVWIAIVESDQPFEFKFLICDSRFPIAEYIHHGNGYISNIARKKFKQDAIHDIMLSYRHTIEMDDYKSMKVYDNHAAEIVYKKGIEDIVASKTGLEIVQED